jgi:hypothetical protein
VVVILSVFLILGMLNGIMLNGIMLNGIMLNGIMLIVVMLNVAVLSVVMLSVVAAHSSIVRRIVNDEEERTLKR